MKKQTLIAGILLSFMYNGFAQNLDFGKISDIKGGKLETVAGQIGNSVYTVHYQAVKGKKNAYYINKCSAATMATEATDEIETGEIDLRKNSWGIVKVDNKLVLIVAVWDRAGADKIYGETLVGNDGKTITGNNLKLISEWKSHDFKGKKAIFGEKAIVIASHEIEGMPTANNKIMVCFKYTDGDAMHYTDVFLNFMVIDKDLKKVDEQFIDFGEKNSIRYHIPMMDADGNAYIIPWGYEYTNQSQDFCYIYDATAHKLNKKTVKIDKFKAKEELMSVDEFLFNSKGNLTFTGLMRTYVPDKRVVVAKAAGYYYCEMNLNGETTLDYMLFDKEELAENTKAKNGKAGNFYSTIEMGMTKNYVICMNTICEGIDHGAAKMGKGPQSIEYTILKMENSKLIKVKSYSSDAYYFYTGPAGTFSPEFAEKNDKVYMVFAPDKTACQSLKFEKPSDLMCALNVFDLKGKLETTRLFNVEKMNPTPRNKRRLKDGSIVVWGYNDQDPVRISFK